MGVDIRSPGLLSFRSGGNGRRRRIREQGLPIKVPAFIDTRLAL
jgi:hypothetical protein